MTDGAAVAREEAVTSALLGEASQYRTVQTLQRWPLVTNAAAAVTDRYHTLKVRLVGRFLCCRRK